MCSSGLSGWKCSRSAANGKTASASPGCAKPKRTPEPVRNAECGMRSKNCRPLLFFPIPHSALRISHLNGSLAKISGGGGHGFAARRGANDPGGPGGSERRDGATVGDESESTARPGGGGRQAGAGEAEALCGL